MAATLRTNRRVQPLLPRPSIGLKWLFGSSRGCRGDGGELGPVGTAGIEQHAYAPVGPVRDSERDTFDALGEIVDRLDRAVAGA